MRYAKFVIQLLALVLQAVIVLCSSNPPVPLYHYEHKIQTVNPESLSVKTEFDPYGNPLRITDGNGNVTTYQYDDRQNLVMMTTPGRKISAWEYDGYDRVVKRSTPAGDSYDYHYENGNLKTITDSRGEKYGLTFNRNHELEEMSYPNGLKRRWGYDANGRLVKSEDVKGNNAVPMGQSRQPDPLGGGRRQCP